MKLLTIIPLLSLLALTNLQAAEQVNVYSARKEALIKPLFDKFTKETGVAVNLVTGNADNLITRLKSEGKYSPADLLITTDVGRLQRAKEQGLSQPLESDILAMAIPENYRDQLGHWFGLTLRARPIMFAKDKVQASELNTLENLADPKWMGRICIRSSSNIYNQSMVAAMIEQLGEEKTETWVKAFVKNFARSPKGGDRDQIKALAAGQCDIAIANTYYLAGMLSDGNEQEKTAAAAVSVFWPNQLDRGTHVNISGASLTKNAPNKAAAIHLLEYMTQPNAQQWYAEANHEYPLLSGVPNSKILRSFGEFKAESVNLERVGELNGSALKLMDRAGWQ